MERIAAFALKTLENPRSKWATTSKQSRGYGAVWERLRRQILERDRWLCQCRHCKAGGFITVAHEVDHIVSKARAKRLGWTDAQTDDPCNLQSINKGCHERKTIEETGRTLKPRVGLDGYPVQR